MNDEVNEILFYVILLIYIYGLKQVLNFQAYASDYISSETPLGMPWPHHRSFPADIKIFHCYGTFSYGL